MIRNRLKVELWVLFKNNQVVLRNFGCYSGSAGVNGGHLENEDFGESEVYRCKSEPIAKTSPADKLKSNAPPGATFSKTNSNVIKEPTFATEDASLVWSDAFSINNRDKQDN